MTTASRPPTTFDPALDLVLERVVDVPRELVWAAWTRPDLIERWFTPAPWRTTDCRIDLRPGGSFFTVMRGPAGEVVENEGCYLEIVPNERLVWTSALAPGFRPRAQPEDAAGFLFTAVIALEPHVEGTRYTATGIHTDAESRKKHADMGFHAGWGKALDQLVALAKTL